MVRVHAGPPWAVAEVEDPLPVILLSSSHTPEAFVQLVSELDLRDVDFEVVHGVETDAKRMLAVMQRLRDRALYVLCMDEVLDRDCAERLEAAVLLSGFIRGRSVMSLSIEEYPIDSLAEMLATRARRLAQRESLDEAPPPPPSVEPLPGVVESIEPTRSPFEVADGPLDAPAVAWPLSRRTTLVLGGLAFVALALISKIGDDSEPVDSRAPWPIAVAEHAAEEPAAPLPEGVVEAQLRAAAAEHESLRRHELRSLDLLLIDPHPSARAPLAEARAHCAALDTGQLSDWRLPTVAEISAVGQARLVAPEYYWTETLGDAATAKQVVYDSRRMRMLGRTPGWKGARAVCVRERTTPGVASLSTR